MIGFIERKLDNGLQVYNLTICGFKYGRDLYSMWQVEQAILKVGEPHPNDFDSDAEAREALELSRAANG